MECNQEQGYIVHHKITLTEDNIHDAEIALNHRNMMYVCKACHDQYEGHGVGHGRVKPLCIFDDTGQPISLRDVDSPRKSPWLFGLKRPTAQIRLKHRSRIRGVWLWQTGRG